MAAALYLDQNYLSGIAKDKPAFAGLEQLLRAGVLSVRESPAHALESSPRPDPHEIYSGRRGDVARLAARLRGLLRGCGRGSSS